MAHLTKARIQHYRSIADASLEFDPAITAIIGTTDSGKSNVIRAIRDALYGARGTACIEARQEAAEVHLFFEDGLEIRWKKAKKDSTVAFFKGDGDGITYSGHGSEIPPPISEASGFRDYEIDRGISIRPNISEQHDPYFLLRETPSAIAKVIGAVSGLHIVYAAAREADVDARAQAKLSEKAEEEKKVAADSFHAAKKGLEEAKIRREVAEAQARAFEEASARVLDLESSMDSLSYLRDSLVKKRERFEKAERMATIAKGHAQALQVALAAEAGLAEAMEERKKRREALACAHHRLEEAEASIKALQEKLSRIEACPLCRRPFDKAKAKHLGIPCAS